jgi:hypothetical protein
LLRSAPPEASILPIIAVDVVVITTAKEVVQIVVIAMVIGPDKMVLCRLTLELPLQVRVQVKVWS